MIVTDSKIGKQILRLCGGSSLFFLWNGLIIARIRYQQIFVAQKALI